MAAATAAAAATTTTTTVVMAGTAMATAAASGAGARGGAPALPKFALRAFGGETTFLRNWGNTGPIQDISDGVIPTIDIQFLRRQPTYVSDESEARFVFAVLGDVATCYGQIGQGANLESCLNRSWYPRFRLPPRPPESPWVVNTQYMNFVQCLFAKQLQPQPFCTDAAGFLARRDVIAVSFSLRDQIKIHMTPWQRSHPEIQESRLDQLPPLRGVTIAAGGCYGLRRTPRHRARKQPRYLVVFKGWDAGDKPPRGDLGRAFQNTSDPRVAIEVAKAPPKGGEARALDLARYRDLLMNTAYFLYVRGHGRWLTHDRLSGGLCACAIPVFVSDGLTLPFEEVIDWPKASLRIAQRHAAHPDAFLAHIPRDPGVIRQMRERACDIYDRHFANESALVASLLLSIDRRRQDPGSLWSGAF